MKCPYCNAEIEDGAKFCTSCGRQLGEEKKDSSENLPDEPPKKDMEKLIRIITIASAVLMTVIVAVFLGIRSYSSRKYEEGKTAYENKDYEAAVSSLSSAYSWGAKEKAGVMLADSYYHLGRYEDAYETFGEIILDDNAEALAVYADTCEQLAYKNLAANNPDMAVAYLEREYELTGDERVNNRIKAIEGGGTYADENGNVYNLDGLPEVLVLQDERGQEAYRAEIVYDQDEHIQYVKAYKNGSIQKTVYGTFDWAEAGEYELSVYPSGDAYSWIAEKTVTDNGMLKSITSNSEASKQTLAFTYTRNSDGVLKGEKITSSSGKTASIEWQGGEYPENGVMTVDDTAYIIVLSYDGKGNVTSMKMSKSFLQSVMQADYTYNENGQVTRSTVKNTGAPFTFWKPALAYSDTVTEYSAGKPVSRTVRDADGNVIARGWYISGSGWLMMYLPD